MKRFYLLYDNNLDAFFPQLWAQESLAILDENMVIGMLVHRDFENTLARFGDTVNTRQPAEFTAQRKGLNDSVTIQNVTATNVAVKLNQLVHTSFLLRDGEETWAFKDLVTEYLEPAMVAQARFVDQVLLGQYAQFIGNGAGKLDGLSSSTAKSYILDARKKMNTNKVPEAGRNLIWTPNSESEVLQLDLFISADKIGDDGTAMREASIGRKLQFNHWMSQNASTIAVSSVDKVTGAINNAAGYAAGTTTFTVDGLSAAIPVNSWLTIAGDMSPLRVVSSVGGAAPTAVTVTNGTNYAVVDNAVVTLINPGAVNLAAGYAVGYDSTIVVDGFTNTPEAGQLVTFGTDPTGPVYSIIRATSTTILLDRPLEVALTDNETVNPGPPGEYNFGFTKNAMALVVRPLAAPRPGVGALSAVVNYNGLAMRATITYDGDKQGHLVTLDMLMGVKTLNSSLGVVLFG